MNKKSRTVVLVKDLKVRALYRIKSRKELVPVKLSVSKHWSVDNRWTYYLNMVGRFEGTHIRISKRLYDACVNQKELWKDPSSF